MPRGGTAEPESELKWTGVVVLWAEDQHRQRFGGAGQPVGGRAKRAGQGGWCGGIGKECWA